MAAQKQQEFCDLLLAIGNGTQPTLPAHGLSKTDDTVQLPPSMVSSAKTLDEFIDQVFGELGTADLTGKAILSTLNSEINAINARVTERFPGQVKLSNAPVHLTYACHVSHLAVVACLVNCQLASQTYGSNFNFNAFPNCQHISWKFLHAQCTTELLT